MKLQCQLCDKEDVFTDEEFEDNLNLAKHLGWRCIKIRNEWYWYCSRECQKEAEE